MSKYYIFHADEYIRHLHGQGPDTGYPMKIKDHWSGYPSSGSWSIGPFIDAALFYPGKNKFYIFRADEYIRHSYGQGPDTGYPMKIKDHWSGYPSSWSPNTRINAAVFYTINNKFYIFHGDEYVRHSYGQGPDTGYPMKIKDHWSGYPSSWEGNAQIDSIAYNPEINKFYIFHGDEYVRHSYGQGPDTGYPMKIKDHWNSWIPAWENDWDFYKPIVVLHYPR